MAATAAVARAGESEAHPSNQRLLILAALGVVYGDIGTSPLYTLREAFGHAGGLHLSEGAVFGVLSLVFWSLMFIVTLKYVILILRADNRGEGGVLALGTHAARAVPDRPQLRRTVLMLALVGLVLFYGDGLITPAISVLSAVEGLETAAPALQPYVMPLAAAVLLALFVLQSRGSAGVGALFGPVMMVWFITLALLGLVEIVRSPWVLQALDPRWAVGLFQIVGWQAFLALGAVVLAVTGAEALYADMGHFGPRPIRIAWFGLVLPALVLNYFGQGALVLRDPSALGHPFFNLAPDWLLGPLIGLATMATVIASQAVISGVFSLTRQAVRLGHMSRMTIEQTSAAEIGQVYIPRMNWLLMAGVLLLVVGFRSSSNLAAAYGISVTGAMSIDAVLAGIVAASRWGWGPVGAGAVFGGFLVIDLGYFAANAHKIPSGGWLPLVVAAAFLCTVASWRRGREFLRQRIYGDGQPLKAFVADLDPMLHRAPGTAVFMTGNRHVVPVAPLHNVRRNNVVHERVVIMTVRVRDEPHVPELQRVTVQRLGKGFYRVTASYGFMDEPDIPRALVLCRPHGLPVDLELASYFLSRETLVPSERPAMSVVEERLFMLLTATNLPATAYFRLPPNQVVELGFQVEV
ncbi:MAG: potassium transporter Kup [Geminicoccaceae bacterium]